MLSSTWICTSLNYHHDLSIDIVFSRISASFNFCGENLQEIFDVFFYLILVMDQQDVVATGGIDTNVVLSDRLVKFCARLLVT